MRHIYQILILFIIACVGLGIWDHGAVHADGGFDVPKVDDQFNQFDQSPSPQKEQPISPPPVKEEKGFWDKVTDPIADAWDWTTDKISGAWEWTKEKAAAFWDWLTEICSKMAEVVVDALKAAWDWIVKFKEYIAFAGVLILGVVLCFVAPPLGAAVLTGMALSFLIGAGLNGWKIDKTTFMEAAIGGLLGLVGGGIAGGAARGLASGLGQKLITGAANSKLLGPIMRGGSQIVSKLPKPLQQVFGKGGAIGAVEGTGTSVADDLLHGRSIDWKKAFLSGVAGALTVGVVSFATPMVSKAADSVAPYLAKTPIIKNIFKTAGDCVAVKQTRGFYALALLEVKTGCINLNVLKQDLENLRKKVKTDVDTIAVGRTDIEGLEDKVFEGGSPEVVKAAPPEAGLKPLDPNRPIQAPFKSPQFTRHAEEMVINEFVKAVDAKFPNPLDVKGKLYIHQSNTKGVCSACKSGLGRSPNKGVLHQLSKRYPNLEIHVSSEIKEGSKVTKSHFFVLKNGKQIK